MARAQLSRAGAARDAQQLVQALRLAPPLALSIRVQARAVMPAGCAQAETEKRHSSPSQKLLMYRLACR